MRDIGSGHERFCLIADQKQQRDCGIKIFNFSPQSSFQPQCAEAGEQYQDPSLERLSAAAPVKERINECGNQSPETLTVRAMLPAKNLPQCVMLEEGTVFEIPVIPEEEIDGITVDKDEELCANHKVTGANQQQRPEFAPGFDLGVFSLNGRNSW